MSSISFSFGPTLSPSPQPSGGRRGIPISQEALVGILVGVAIVASCLIMLARFLKMSPRARGLRNFITCSRIRRRGRVDSREQAESERNLWMPGNGTFHISPELLHSALSPIPTIYDPRQARNYVTRGFDVDEGGRRVGSQADDDGNGVDEKDELPAYTRHSIRLPTYAESDNQDLPEQLPLPVTHPTS